MKNRQSCPHCGRVNDRQTEVMGTATSPLPGAISICAQCLRLSIFDQNGEARDLTETEQERLILSESWPMVCAAQKALAKAKVIHGMAKSQ